MADIAGFDGRGWRTILELFCWTESDRAFPLNARDARTRGLGPDSGPGREKTGWVGTRFCGWERKGGMGEGGGFPGTQRRGTRGNHLQWWNSLRKPGTWASPHPSLVVRITFLGTGATRLLCNSGRNLPQRCAIRAEIHNECAPQRRCDKAPESTARIHQTKLHA